MLHSESDKPFFRKEYDASHNKLNHKQMAEEINKQDIWVSMY